MPSLKEVRTRISSVSSTQQITSAMKMVSAAKFKKAQDAIIQMRPYAEKLQQVLENVAGSLSSSDGPFSRPREIRNVLIIVVTSNRGLCGGFNSSVIKKTSALIREKYQGKNISILCLGKKGHDFFRKSSYKLITKPDVPGSAGDIFDDLNYPNASPYAEKVMEMYSKGQFDRVDIVYNKFKNAATQVVTVEQFLPVPPPSGDKKKKSVDYFFEPDLEFIVEDLIPRSLKTQLFKTLLDSVASEHGARMTAMHKATDNAKDMLRELRITYNKARQAAITKEILEIVGGAEALNN